MGLRADLVVEDKVIVEIKSIAELGAVHKKSSHLLAAVGQTTGLTDQLQ